MPPLSLADASNRIRDLEKAQLEAASHSARQDKRLKVLEDIALRQQKKIEAQKAKLKELAAETSEALLELERSTGDALQDVRDLIASSGSLKRKK